MTITEQRVADEAVAVNSNKDAPALKPPRTTFKIDGAQIDIKDVLPLSLDDWCTLHEQANITHGVVSALTPTQLRTLMRLVFKKASPQMSDEQVGKIRMFDAYDVAIAVMNAESEEVDRSF